MDDAPFWKRLTGAVLGPFGLMLIVALLAAAAGLGPLPEFFK